jgi:hypothetical protein
MAALQRCVFAAIAMLGRLCGSSFQPMIDMGRQLPCPLQQVGKTPLACQFRRQCGRVRRPIDAVQQSAAADHFIGSAIADGKKWPAGTPVAG